MESGSGVCTPRAMTPLVSLRTRVRARPRRRRRVVASKYFYCPIMAGSSHAKNAADALWPRSRQADRETKGSSNATGTRRHSGGEELRADPFVRCVTRWRAEPGIDCLCGGLCTGRPEGRKGRGVEAGRDF